MFLLFISYNKKRYIAFLELCVELCWINLSDLMVVELMVNYDCLTLFDLMNFIIYDAFCLPLFDLHLIVHFA